MKKIWNFLKHHFREDFDWKHYLAVAVLLAVIIVLNYSYEFEDSYLQSLSGLKKFVNYFALYAIPYFTSVVLYARFNKSARVIQSKEFFVKSFFGLAILSFDSSVPFLQPLLERVVPNEILYWSYKVSIRAIGIFTVFFPIIMFQKVFEKKDGDVYGLKPVKFDMKPYFIMLLMMIPVIMIASGTESFVRQYPMYKSSAVHTYFDISEWIPVAIYELAYGLDFITVEFLFRGFLVIGMMSSLGRGAVLSMAVVYCTLHFGKPMGEAISSIFGGYILGVIAYETRSIWGGVIVHIGIAWMMELIAFVQKFFH
jgi:hypothetical protein